MQIIIQINLQIIWENFPGQGLNRYQVTPGKHKPTLIILKNFTFFDFVVVVRVLMLGFLGNEFIT